MKIDLLKGAIDNHVHCCPHINKRSTNVFEVVKKAEQLKMHAIGQISFGDQILKEYQCLFCHPFVPLHPRFVGLNSDILA